MSHSPGPWEWEEDFDEPPIDWTLRDARDGIVLRATGNRGHRVTFADRDLIVNAPTVAAEHAEMLALLRDMGRVDSGRYCMRCEFVEEHKSDCPLGALLSRLDTSAILPKD